MSNKYMKSRVSPQEAQDLLRDGKAVLIDVRSLGEFAACRAVGAECIPLPDLERRAGEIPNDKVVLVICQHGSRSRIGAERLRALGVTEIADVAGGTVAWKAAGLSTISTTGHRDIMPLERQVRLVAGLLVSIFSLLGFLVAPQFHYGAAFIGFMLFITATLGICPMISILQWMPWNRAATNPASRMP